MSSGADKPNAVKAVRETSRKAQDQNLIELSTGVVLRLLEDIDPLTLMDVMTRMEEGRPEVPVVHIKSLGRSEQNPDDPDYIARLRAWETVYALEMSNVLILLGTELKKVPEGVEKITDTVWLDKLRVLKVEVDDSEPGHYLAWVKHVAIKTADDMNLLMSRVKRIAGVSEADVADASDTFQD